MLVFLPGEREIREAAEALRKHHPPGVEILPLFARLSAEEQDRVFEPRSARRIVLATNVAETSLTVPGIHYVIDTGLARDQALRRAEDRPAADRADLPGGGAPARGPLRARRERHRDPPLRRGGFRGAPEFTTPEILRTSLAAVILRMPALELGSVEDFPFLDAADARHRGRLRSFFELGAIDGQNALTTLGRELARLPVDPRIGRMLLAARGREALREMVIVAARSRPGRARPPARAAAGRRPRAREVPRRHVGVPRHAQALEVVRALARRARRARVDAQARAAARDHFLSTRACANGATSTRSCSRWSPSTAAATTRARRPTSRCTGRCWPACSATSA